MNWFLNFIISFLSTNLLVKFLLKLVSVLSFRDVSNPTKISSIKTSSSFSLLSSRWHWLRWVIGIYLFPLRKFRQGMFSMLHNLPLIHFLIVFYLGNFSWGFGRRPVLAKSSSASPGCNFPLLYEKIKWWHVCFFTFFRTGFAETISGTALIGPIIQIRSLKFIAWNKL